MLCLNRPALKILTTAIIGALTFGLPATQVYATAKNMNWTPQETFNDPGGVDEIYKSLNTNHIYLSNNMGGAVAMVKLGPQQTKDLVNGGNTFSMPWNTRNFYKTGYRVPARLKGG